MAINYPTKPALGAEVNNFPKTQQAKIKEIIDAINELNDGDATFVDLTVTNDLTVNGGQTVDGSVTIGQSLEVGDIFYLTDTPQTLTGAGAVNTTTEVTLLVTTGANALTLANGTDGQTKIIIMKTDGGDGTLTPTSLNGGTTITFSAVGQTATLLYKDSKWNVIGLVGAILA